MWEPAISGMEKAHNCADLSYRRIRRYLVWRLKRLEARDFSRVRIKFLIHDLDYEELTDYRKLYKYLRELRPLQAIRDHYPKIILTMDEEPEEQYEGIRRINARDWLLGIVDWTMQIN